MNLPQSLIAICYMLIDVVTWIVIAQFVLGMLLSFNVVNAHNDLVNGLWRGLNALLEPVLRPIRKIMPDTRPMDFSPLVLILLLRIATYLIAGVANSAGGY